MQQIHCIVNPAAGHGRTSKKWPKIKRAMEECGLSPKAVFTSGKEHAVHLSRELAVQGAATIVGVGGDGTLSEIVNGIVGTDTALAIIPCGTGNDFARTIGVPHNPLTAVRGLKTSRKKCIDLLSADGRFYLNAAGVGFDAEVARQANQGIRFLSGVAAYLAAILKVFCTYQPATAVVRIDAQEIKTKLLLVAIGNGRYYGGGMMITPFADISDGQLDICIVKDISRLQFLKAFPRIFSGRHVSHPLVNMYRGACVEVTTCRKLPVQADGEIIGETPIQFQVAPKALHVLVPESTCVSS